MRLDPFKLERYLAQYEFTAPHQLSCSDCDGLAVSDVLSLAGDETRQLWDGLKLGYTESAGHPLLRAEIAGQYADVGEDYVLVAGPQELIFVLMNCLVRNGDHVVCTYPAYQSLYQVAESLHCEVSFWEADEKSGWRFDPEVLENLVRPSTRVLVVNFPHNPTGYLPSGDEFDAIVEVARRHDLTLLCDEMYRGLEYDEAQRLPAAVDLYERAVSLSGMSKVYGLAGLRVGWIATRDARLLKRVTGFKDYTSICSSAPSEILSLIALRARVQIVERHMARIRRNRDALADFIDTYKNLFTWNPPRAGTVCLPRVLPETLSADDLCREAVNDAGVVLVPSSVFDYGDRHVRFGLGREAFSEALAVFDRFLDAKLRGVPMPSPAAIVESPAPPAAPAAPEPVAALEPVAVAEVPQTPEPAAAPEPAAPAEPAPALDASPPPEPVGDGSWDDRLVSAGAVPEPAVELRPEPDQELAPWEDFPPSAIDAHPVASTPVAEPTAALSATVDAESGEAPPEDDEAALPLEPDLPDGIERGTGLLPDGFFEGEPAPVTEEWSPAEPLVAEPDLPAAEPEPLTLEPEAPVDEPAPPVAEPPSQESYEPPPGSWETIEPPPGSSMTILPPPPGDQDS